MSPAEALQRGVAAIGLSLSPRQFEQLMDYLALLQKWNRVYNLTAIRDADRIVSQHLLDCLVVVPHLSGRSLLDVGTGAGLPGIPIAIATPERAVTLLDSNTKKTAFLRQAVGELGLTNVSVSDERVENWHSPTRFELIISRAFAELRDFVTACRPLLATGGSFLAMKGVHPEEEIQRLPTDFRVRDVKRIDVPGLDAERHLVWIEPA